MAKKIISLGDDLLRRMDRVREPVNWSAVAREAFERKLGEIAARKESKTMQDVIDRLKASELEDASEQQAEGRKAGELWAQKRASARELRLLDKMTGEELDAILDSSEPAFSLVRAVLLRGEPDHQVAEEWLERAGIDKDRWSDVEFLRAFVVRACEIWEAV